MAICNVNNNYTETSVAECTNGAVRLTGGVANSSSGRVEVCVNGVWGSVCDKLGDWIMSPYNAVTVCRQLNLPTDSKTIMMLAWVLICWTGQRLIMHF